MRSWESHMECSPWLASRKSPLLGLPLFLPFFSGSCGWQSYDHRFWTISFLPLNSLPSTACTAPISPETSAPAAFFPHSESNKGSPPPPESATISPHHTFSIRGAPTLPMSLEGMFLSLPLQASSLQKSHADPSGLYRDWRWAG